MKTLSKLLIVVAVLFCGCSNDKEKYVIKERPDVKVEHFEHNGHKYIEFSRCDGYKGYAGVVHDPDCPCFDTTKQLEK